MLETLVLFLIVVLIVMPVVAILLMGLQRVTGSQWPPLVLAVAALAITVVLVVAYLFLT